MFKAKNWSSFQSFKDRSPPWIRLHKRLIDDINFQKMSVESRALLPMIWLLISEDEDPVSGLLRIGYEELSFRLRQPEKIIRSSIQEIVKAGFLEEINKENSNSYIDVTDLLQNCHPETETETETETEEMGVSRKRSTNTRGVSFKNWLDEIKKTDPDVSPTACPDILADEAEKIGFGHISVTEWEKFHDYWIALSGQKAVKSDWVATWRNWIRRSHG